MATLTTLYSKNIKNKVPHPFGGPLEFSLVATLMQTRIPKTYIKVSIYFIRYKLKKEDRLKHQQWYDYLDSII